MAYLALYRQWRPQSFAQVVGQVHITRTIRNALRRGELAHAYLFSGPRGTGKTTVAKVLAKAVNCLQPRDGEPCNECQPCGSITAGTAVDVLEIDAASNRGIDEIRELKDKVRYAPAQLRRKVYIVDEVHMLTEPAFNALLKTLEEPPAHVLFILATTDPQKVPPTIVSRCQRFEFHRFTDDEVLGHLRRVLQARGVNAEAGALERIARAADGGMRDALSLADQVLAYSGDALRAEDVLTVLGAAPSTSLDQLADALAARDAATCLRLVDDLARQGKDMRQVLRDLLAHLRDLLLVALGAAPAGADPARQEQQRRLVERFPSAELTEAIKVLASAEGDMRWAPQPRLALEIALARLCLLPPGGDVVLRPASSATAPHAAPPPPTPPTPEPAQATAPRPAGQGARRRSPARAAATSAPSRERAAAFPPAKTEVAATAPPPAVAAPPPPPPAGGEPTLATILASWSTVLERLRQRNVPVQALLIEGRPQAFNAGRLEVGFSSRHQIHRQRLDKDEPRALVERVLAEVFGQAMTVAFVPAEDEDSAALQRREAAEHPHVKRVLEVLGGEVAEVREE